MPLLVLAAGLLSIAFGERIPVGFGYGWDGWTYGLWTKDYYGEVLVKRVPTYKAPRVLPPAIVHYGLRAANVPLDDWHIIKAYQVWNMLWLALAAFVWTLAASRLGLGLPATWLGFLSLFVNFGNLKHCYYYPVLMDSAGFGLGMLMLHAYLAGSALAQGALAVVGAFVWPQLWPAGLLLFLLPRRETVIEPAKGGKNWAAALAACAAFALAAGYAHFALRLPLENHAPPVLESMAIISLILASALIVAGLSRLLDAEFLYSWESLKAHVAWRRLPAAALLALAVSLARVRVTDPSAPSSNAVRVLWWTVLGAIAKPLYFLVTHALYYGPVVLLLVVAWPRAVRVVQRQGLGLVAYVAATLGLALGPESRLLMFALPAYAAIAAKAADEAGMPKWAYAAFAAASVALSKFWFVINAEPFSEPALPERFQRYFMHMGPFLLMPSYLWHAAIAAALLLVLWWGLRSPRRARGIGPERPMPALEVPLLQYAVWGGTVVLLWSAVRNGFAGAEDFESVVFGRVIRWADPLAAFQLAAWITHGWDNVLGGGAPAGFHFTNLAIHGLNAALLFRLILAALRKARPADPAVPWAASMLAASYALLPLCALPLACVSRRGYLLAMTFSAAAGLARLTAGDSTGRAAWTWYGLGLASFAAALLSSPVAFANVWIFYAAALLGRARLPAWPFALLAAAGFWAVATARFPPALWLPWAYALAWPIAPALCLLYVRFASPFSLAGACAGALFVLIFLFGRPQIRLEQDPVFLWSHALDKDPSCDVCRLNLAWVAADEGRWLKASELARDVIAGEPSAATPHVIRTLAGYGMRDAVGGAGAAKNARALDPKLSALYAERYFRRGFEAAMRGDMDGAMIVTRAAVALDPAHADARFNLGTFLGQKGLVDEAIAELREAARLKPGAANIHHNLGVYLMQRGFAGLAAAEFLEALRLDPSDAGARANLEALAGRKR